MRKHWEILAALILSMTLAGAPAASQTESQTTPPEQRYTPGVVWVKLAPEAGEAAAQAGEWQSRPVSGRLQGTPWVRLAVPIGEEEATVDTFQQRADVLAAEPEYFVHAMGTPNDPEYRNQWNMNIVGAPLAWDMTTGNADVIVAIVDTGVDLTHADLQGNLWQNFGEVPNNGIDDDRNGYVDDRWGWDIVNNDATPQDDYGHGTHVAGIVGAVGNNARGVAGMAWQCRLMAVKVLDRSGNGTYAGVAAGVQYAAQNGAQIVNMSLAGSDYSQILQDAIYEAYQRQGVLSVAAAGNCALGGGNCGSVNPIMYPGAMHHVVSVAATDINDQRWSLSEYNAFVDLAAPGAYVYSTGMGGGYRYMSGTSMATPHVSGLAALIRILRPEWTPDQIEAHLKATAEQIGGIPYPDGRNDSFGFGRINAAAAIWTLDPPRLALSQSQLAFQALGGETVTMTAILSSNSAGFAQWSAEVTPAGDWLTVSPASGVVSLTSPETLTLTTQVGLPSGLYRGQVRVMSSNPYWDGAAPTMDVYILAAAQLYRYFYPFVFLSGRQESN